jgi:type II secretory pathway component GspD/PulD (secretin)
MSFICLSKKRLLAMKILFLIRNLYNQFIHPQLIPITFLSVLLQLSSASWAGSIWGDGAYSIYANQDSLSAILESLGESQGMTVVVSDSINELVSLNLEGKNRSEVFQVLVSTYGLTWYFDGYSLFVDRLSNTKTETITLQSISPRAFKRQLVDLGLLSSVNNYYWKAVERKGLISISGLPPFVDRVKQVAMSLDDKKNKVYYIYKWRADNGQMHFSSDPTEAPVHAESMEYYELSGR